MRHNSLGKATLWRSQWGNFLCNRLALTVLAMLALALTVWLYESRRKGRGERMRRRMKDERRNSDGEGPENRNLR